MDLYPGKEIGEFKAITMNMEVRFEMKIENLGSMRVDGHKTVLFIDRCFNFGLKKSAEESNYYIHHGQYPQSGDGAVNLVDLIVIYIQLN